MITRRSVFASSQSFAARETDREMPSASRSARFARAAALPLLVASLLLPRAHAEIHGAFAHGVASGDPTSDSVIIWTRVTPVGRDQPDDWDPAFDDAFEVTWTVATKPPWRSPREGTSAFLPEAVANGGDAPSDVGGGSYPFASEDAFDFGWGEGSVEKTGVVTATAARDWTVKIDVGGLASNVRYYYAFEVGTSVANEDAFGSSRRKKQSPVGAFVLPPPVGTPYPDGSSRGSPSPLPLKFAVFSCANWAFGHFHAYDAAHKGWGAELAAWLHLGDYYYEYGEDNYPNHEESVSERYASLRPRNETWTLEDYRARHALYRSDDALQKLHAAAPVIAMWDDHEIANNEYTAGGENHQPDREGVYSTRARAAVRAYHEWLPTREPSNTHDWTDTAHGPFAYNRSVHFGNVVSFVVPETRVVARTDPNANPAGNVFANLTRRFSRSSEKLAPARWAGSALEADLKRFASELNAYRARDDAYMLGAEQTRWVAAEARRSRDEGVAWQVFAQASPVMNGKSPDVEKAADALDAAKKHAPPGAYDSWRAALRAWTAYDDDDGASRAGAFGVGGRGVGVAAARALLALGRYGINWDFDDWRGYVAERVRFLNAVTSSSNRALVLGGDSHDAWAGVVPGDRKTWGLGDEAADSVKHFDAAAVAEFDAPGVTPPGAFEQAFQWAPHELIDEGHVRSNPGTMKYARTGNRGFLLLSVDENAARGDFFFTPSVRERTYVPECGASFEVREAGGGKTVPAPSGDGDGDEVPFRGAKLLKMTDAACPALPESLFVGSDELGYAGAVRRRGGVAGAGAHAADGDCGDAREREPAVSFAAVFATALSCAFAGGVVGYYFPKKHQARPGAWKYESVAESDRSDQTAERDFRNLSPQSRRERSRSRGSRENVREVELSV